MPILPAFAYTPAGGTEIVINFDEPIQHSDKLSLDFKGRDSFSGSGVMQRQLDYVNDKFVISQVFSTEAQRDAVETMMRDHVGGGGSFKYIPDNNSLGTFDTVQLTDKGWDGATRDALAINFFKWTLNVRLIKT